MLLYNARIFTNNHLQKGYLVINDGKISEIGKGNLSDKRKNLSLSDKSSNSNNLSNSSEVRNKIIDCKNGILLPGFIDAHVHFRDMKQSEKETLSTGSKGAISAGVTTVLTMPNTTPSLSKVNVIKEYQEIALNNSLFCNLGLFAAVKEGFNLEKIDEICKLGIFGIKIYPGDNSDNLNLEWEEGWEKDESPTKFIELIDDISSNFIHSYKNWEKLFKIAAEKDLPLLFHPELPKSKKKMKQAWKNAIVIATNENKENKNLFAHDIQHPIYSNELAFVEMIISFLLKFYPDPKKAPRINFVHVSNADSIKIIEEILKIKKYPVSIEVAPHHMLLNYEKHFINENFGKVLVPLRSPMVQKKLKKIVQNDEIDTFGTDHAPHTREEKLQDFENAPSGFPSIDFASKILLTEVFKGTLTLKQFCRYYSSNPAKIFNIKNKGKIKKGYDADLVLVREVDPYKIKGSDMVSKQKWTPWEGRVISAEISKVYLAGNLAYDNKIENFYEPYGKILKCLIDRSTG